MWFRGSIHASALPKYASNQMSGIWCITEMLGCDTIWLLQGHQLPSVFLYTLKLEQGRLGGWGRAGCWAHGNPREAHLCSCIHCTERPTPPRIRRKDSHWQEPWLFPSRSTAWRAEGDAFAAPLWERLGLSQLLCKTPVRVPGADAALCYRPVPWPRFCWTRLFRGKQDRENVFCPMA